MELQFQRNTLDCLRPVLSGIKSQEQTQEVRLPEAMPDIGKILAAWGQTVLRSKEWHGPAMGASGGVMAWILYAPEDGTFPRVVEAWIPWQLQWELPQTQRDGAMILRPTLKSVDARAVSARKLMVRACVDAAAEAYEPVRLETWNLEAAPEHICLLKKTYPVCLPVEAGEKTCGLEETLTLPQECQGPGKLLHYRLQPQLQEQKLLGDKLVLRGSAALDGLWSGEEEALVPIHLEIPFSMYTELEADCSENALIQVAPAVTNLEVETEESGCLRLKASLVAQYLIADRKLLEVVEDGYSPGKEVTLEYTELRLPVILELSSQTEPVQLTQALQGQALVEATVLGAQPEQFRSDGQVQLTLQGTCQILYRDENGQLQADTAKWEHKQSLPTGEGVQLLCTAEPVGTPAASLTATAAQVCWDMAVQRCAGVQQSFSMVTALQCSEGSQTEPRPSLILRRPCGDSLWEIAKACGSTREAICQVNGLAEDTPPDRMLLIPVL